MGGLNLNALIHSASKQLGMTPEALKKALDSGDISSITAHLSSSDRAKVENAVKDPALAEKLRRQYMGKK